MLKPAATVLLIIAAATPCTALRSSQPIKNWEFSKDSVSWKNVNVPHDWAIYGPFSRDNDPQKVTVEQNGETEATWKTGRTGGLPYMGKGFYKTGVEVPDTTGKTFTLEFDGAMSNPVVYVNGRRVGNWAYGYNSFYINVPQGLMVPGRNSVEVSLENKPRSSRWYPGAGLYRNVRLVTTSPVHVPTWGTYIVTPFVSGKEASVRLSTEIAGAARGEQILVKTDILDPDGNIVAQNHTVYHSQGQPFVQDFIVKDPKRWSPETPWLYTARTRLNVKGSDVDEYRTRFGIRSLDYIPEKGFFLNGEHTRFKGYASIMTSAPRSRREPRRPRPSDRNPQGYGCQRHPHRPQYAGTRTGGALRRDGHDADDRAFRRLGIPPQERERLWLHIQRMGAARHGEHAAAFPQQRLGDDVVGRQMKCRASGGPDGVMELSMLRDICHRLDPTRPVTCGMDQFGAVIDNGFAATLDIPGFNYKPQYYTLAYEKLPQRLVLGSETASTVSLPRSLHAPDGTKVRYEISLEPVILLRYGILLLVQHPGCGISPWMTIIPG